MQRAECWIIELYDIPEEETSRVTSRWAATRCWGAQDMGLTKKGLFLIVLVVYQELQMSFVYNLDEKFKHKYFTKRAMNEQLQQHSTEP